MASSRLPRGTVVVCVVVLLLLVPGCTGLLGESGEESEGTSTPTEATAATTATDTPSTSDGRTQTPTRTATSTPEPIDEDNPFRERTVTVTLADRGGERDYRPVVRRALDYWEANSAEYAGYPINFTLTDATETSRIRIRFESAPIRCGETADDRSIGCALVNRRTAPETTDVVVAENQTDDYTYDILVHELGHSLGLEHDDEPQEYMQGTLPSGLNRGTVRVFLAGSDDHQMAQYRSEIEVALEYFEDHPRLSADGRPQFETVHSLEQADLVIEVRDGGCDLERGGVCSGTQRYEGQDKIVLDRLDTELVAWYTAYPLASVYFDDGDVPAELSDDTSRRDRVTWDG